MSGLFPRSSSSLLKDAGNAGIGLYLYHLSPQCSVFAPLGWGIEYVREMWQSLHERFDHVMDQFIIDVEYNRIFQCSTAKDALLLALHNDPLRYHDFNTLRVYRLYFDAIGMPMDDVWKRLNSHNINNCLMQNLNCKVNHDEELFYRVSFV